MLSTRHIELQVSVGPLKICGRDVLVEDVFVGRVVALNHDHHIATNARRERLPFVFNTMEHAALALAVFHASPPFPGGDDGS